MPEHPELHDLSLAELCRRIAAKDVSPVELMDSTLARIDRINPILNSIVAERDRDELRADAAAAADRIARGGTRPLEGIALGVKDNVDLAGLPTTEGSLLYTDRVPAQDANQVQRLRAAGAIPIGKTNMPEFGWNAITDNKVFGVTRNPWDLERTPGGSSGGSSSAIASGMLPLATAGDGGGSIRIPASFVGAYGLKPTYGRVPRGPSAHWDHMQVSHPGPLTRTVEDAALFLDQVVGACPTDPQTLPHPGYSYVDALRRPLDRRLRIGYSPDLGYAVVQSDIAAAVDDAVRVFDKLGHTIVDIAGGPPRVLGEWMTALGFEYAGTMRPLVETRADDFEKSSLALLARADQMTPELWLHIQDVRAEVVAWFARVFEDVDILVTPTISFDPGPASGPFPTEVEGRTQPESAVAAFTMQTNFSWNPAASVRVGLSAAGLPVGMQLIGPVFADDLVLQVSAAFERERPADVWPSVG